MNEAWIWQYIFLGERGVEGWLLDDDDDDDEEDDDNELILRNGWPTKCV